MSYVAAANQGAQILSKMASASSTPELLKIASLNVHEFCDESGKFSLKGICDLITSINPDVIGLQEVDWMVAPGSKEKCLEALSRACGLPYVEICIPTFLGNALLSKWKITDVASTKLDHASDHARAVSRALVHHPTGTLTAAVTHLNHERERIRMDQVADVMEHLKPTASGPLVLVGDMNSLTESDYKRKHWEEVARVRERGRWEAPKTAVTEYLHAQGFKDMYNLANGLDVTEFGDVVKFTGALSTCSYGTRIDYVLPNPAFLKDWTPVAHEHVANTCTDHALVVSTFQRRGNCGGAGAVLK
jgi:endonuclease/exonuclease/phosphatase family metal-dependent hydrolase